MDGAALFRRAFHLASPVFLAYFILPDALAPNLPKLGVAILFMGTATCIEVARIALGVKLFGLRPYEGQRVSAYAQGLLGLAFGFFVIQDPRIVVPVFLGMAWIDPLAAHARRKGWPRATAAAAYLALFLVTELLMGAFSPSYALLYALVATTIAILVEGPKIPQLDDDLLMQVVPCVVLYFLIAALGTGVAASL